MSNKSFQIHNNQNEVAFCVCIDNQKSIVDAIKDIAAYLTRVRTNTHPGGRVITINFKFGAERCIITVQKQKSQKGNLDYWHGYIFTTDGLTKRFPYEHQINPETTVFFQRPGSKGFEILDLMLNSLLFELTHDGTCIEMGLFPIGYPLQTKFCSLEDSSVQRDFQEDMRMNSEDKTLTISQESHSKNYKEKEEDNRVFETQSQKTLNENPKRQETKQQIRWKRYFKISSPSPSACSNRRESRTAIRKLKSRSRSRSVHKKIKNLKREKRHDDTMEVGTCFSDYVDKSSKKFQEALKTLEHDQELDDVVIVLYVKIRFSHDVGPNKTFYLLDPAVVSWLLDRKDENKNSTFEVNETMNSEVAAEVWNSEVILCPIRIRNQHWILLIFDRRLAVERSKFLFYSSLDTHGNDPDVLRFVNIFQSQAPSNHFVRDSIRALIPKVPRQKNVTDCGVFVLHNIENYVLFRKNYIDDIDQLEGCGRRYTAAEITNEKRLLIKYYLTTY